MHQALMTVHHWLRRLAGADLPAQHLAAAPQSVPRGWQYSLAGALFMAALASPRAWADEASAPQPVATDVARYAPNDIRFVLKGKGVLGGDLQLQGTLYTPPKGAAPHPLVILSHGSNADATTRRRFSTRGYWNTARYFLNRGFAVLYFLRPSYGESEGPYLEANASCQNASYGPGFESLADTVMAAHAYAQTVPSLDMQRVIFVGHSAGGAASIAASARPTPGVVAYINFGGGKGGSNSTPYNPCSPDEVSKLFAAYAQRTSLPALWVYAPNDLLFGGTIAPRWHQASAAAGGKAQLVVTAPSRTDPEAHEIVQSQLPLWIPAVDTFLKSQGFSW